MELLKLIDKEDYLGCYSLPSSSFSSMATITATTNGIDDDHNGNKSISGHHHPSPHNNNYNDHMGIDSKTTTNSYDDSFFTSKETDMEAATADCDAFLTELIVSGLGPPTEFNPLACPSGRMNCNTNRNTREQLQVQTNKRTNKLTN